MKESKNGNGGVARIIVSCLAFMLVAVVFTWPLVTDLSGVCMRGDQSLNIVIIEHVIDNFFSPDKIFDGPFFYPFKKTIALSEHYIGLAPLYAVLKLATNSPFASMNLLLILSLALSGIGMYLLCLKGFGFKHLPSFFGGLIFAFCHYKVGHLFHLHLIWTVWIPITLLYLVLFLKKPSWKNSFLLCCFLVLQFLSSLYGSLFLLFAIGIIWLFFVLLDHKVAFKEHWKLLLSMAIAIIALSPILINYFEVNSALGLERNGGTILSNFGDIRAFLNTSLLSKVFYADWFKFGNRCEGALMPGFIALALGVAGLIIWFRKSEEGKLRKTLLSLWLNWILLIYGFILITVTAFSQAGGIAEGIASALSTYTIPFVAIPFLVSFKLLTRAWGKNYNEKLYLSFLALGVTGLFLSLGTTVYLNGMPISTGLYQVVYQIFSFMAGFRAPARWIILFTISLSVVAAYTVAYLQERFKEKTVVVNTSICLLAILTLYEYSPVPLYMEKGFPEKAAHSWLAEQKGDFAILEYPVDPVPFKAVEYMFGYLTHRKKTINGYSGFLIGHSHSLSSGVQEFPSFEIIENIRSFPAKYLLVNFNMLKPEQKKSFRKLAESSPLFDEKAFIDEVGIYSINRGARGRSRVMIYPANEKEISFAAKSLHPSEHRSDSVALYVNDQKVETWKTGSRPTRMQVDISGYSKANTTTRIEFKYSMKPIKSVSYSSYNLPFNLELQISGKGKRLTRVIHNGANLNTEKGYNLFLLDSKGDLLSSSDFNTSWYLEESKRLAEFISTAAGKAKYLILVSDFDVARSLTMEAVDALKKIGVATNLMGQDYVCHAAVVDLSSRSTIFESSSKEKIDLLIGESHKDMGFNISRLKTSTVRD